MIIWGYTSSYPFVFDAKAAEDAMLYVLQISGGSISQANFYKVLYFAEKEHLTTYGRPIFGDLYIKMDYGPVPSMVRDWVCGTVQQVVRLSEDRKTISLIHSCASFDYLSDSDRECLQNAFNKVGRLPFKKMVAVSHDATWEAAVLNKPIGINHMLIELPATDQADMIKYFQEGA